MTRPIRPALALLALPLVGAIAGSHFFGGDFATTIASVTPTPTATAAPVPDSPAPGASPAGVESGTENAGIIGDPAYSVVEYATVGETADRLAQVAVGLPPVPPRPTATAGDCASWVPVFEAYGATPDEVAFFVPRIIERESGCGRDTINDRTGDSGVCQINPVHNKAGWFGRVEYGDGGWLHALHGLTTWHDTDSTEWVGACLTLYRVCGSGAWTPPYSCLHRRLP